MPTTTFTEVIPYKTDPTRSSTIRTTLEFEPASIADIDQGSRWFKTVGEHIISLQRVKVTREHNAGTPLVEEGYEILFTNGARAYVSAYGHQDIDALIVGTKGYLHGLAVWRKHKHIVGRVVPWFRCQPSPRGRQNSNTAARCCAAELYALASGKTWGS